MTARDFLAIPLSPVLTTARQGVRAYLPAVPLPLPPPAVPAVGNFSPAVRGPVAQTQPISFDVTNAPGTYRRVLVLVQFPNLKIYDVAYDGTSFGQGYQSQFNSKTSITGGFHFALLREAGWPGSPRIIPIAIDLVGGENLVESQTYAWTLV